MKQLLLLALLSSAGCVPIRTQNSTHRVIIGFGVVSTPRSSSSVPDAVPRVIKTQYLGILAGNDPAARLGIGYGSSISTIVPVNRDLTVEVSDGPLQPVTIRTHE